MRILFTLILLFVLPFCVISQRLIAVQNGGSPSFFTDLDSALTHAQSGDSIYLPSGNFTLNNSLISKEVHILGVGHDPNQSYGNTRLSQGGLELDSLASNSSFHGIYFPGGISLATGNGSVVSNVKFIRCRMGSLSLQKIIGGLEARADGWQIRECALTTIFLQRFSTNNIFTNNFINIIRGISISPVPVNHAGTVFLNNIITSQGGNSFFGGYTNVLFENNLIKGVWGTIKASPGTSFINNIFHGISSFSSEVLAINNIFSGTTPGFEANFVNQSGDAFDFNQDYHLASGSVGVNYGTDGTDVGIYGGLFSWKDNTHPQHPRLILKQIQPTTNSNGDLPVNIKIEAQSN